MSEAEGYKAAIVRTRVISGRASVRSLVQRFEKLCVTTDKAVREDIMSDTELDVRQIGKIVVMGKTDDIPGTLGLDGIDVKPMSSICQEKIVEISDAERSDSEPEVAPRVLFDAISDSGATPHAGFSETASTCTPRTPRGQRVRMTRGTETPRASRGRGGRKNGKPIMETPGMTPRTPRTPRANDEWLLFAIIYPSPTEDLSKVELGWRILCLAVRRKLKKRVRRQRKAAALHSPVSTPRDVKALPAPLPDPMQVRKNPFIPPANQSIRPKRHTIPPLVSLQTLQVVHQDEHPSSSHLSNSKKKLPRRRKSQQGAMQPWPHYPDCEYPMGSARSSTSSMMDGSMMSLWPTLTPRSIWRGAQLQFFPTFSSGPPYFYQTLGGTGAYPGWVQPGMVVTVLDTWTQTSSQGFKNWVQCQWEHETFYFPEEDLHPVHEDTAFARQLSGSIGGPLALPSVECTMQQGTQLADAPGVYWLDMDAFVGNDVELDIDGIVGKVPRGSKVVVKAIARTQDGIWIRGRIDKSPGPGWISLLNLANGQRLARQKLRHRTTSESATTTWPGSDSSDTDA